MTFPEGIGPCSRTHASLVRSRQNGLVRAVVTRVDTAAVTVDGATVGSIGRGLLALVGVAPADDGPRAHAMARKIHELRIFPGAAGEVSAADLGLPVLVVSQFTLYADTRKGRRPSWGAAAPGPVAEPLVEAVVEALRGRGIDVATGRFGADMQVSLVNDGPVTLVLEV